MSVLHATVESNASFIHAADVQPWSWEKSAPQPESAVCVYAVPLPLFLRAFEHDESFSVLTPMEIAELAAEQEIYEPVEADGQDTAVPPPDNLLEAARAMDEEALIQIFDLYSSALYKYVLRLVHDPVAADNIVGDVFAKLLDQYAGGKGPRTNLRSYLYQTAYHLAVDRSRENHHDAPLEVVENREGRDASSTQNILEQRMLFQQIMSAMQTELTEDQRHVIVLRFLEEMSLKETAEILDKEVNHIKVIQNRALAKLRKVFESLDMATHRMDGMSDFFPL